MTERKLLMIGLDGANREAIIDGINRGKLPNISKIAEEGSISTLKAPLPPVTPVSMSSILTGVSPKEHGVYGFENGISGDEGYVDYNDIQSRTLFNYLGQAGGRVISVNVPMTSPLPDSVDIGVSGFPVSGSSVAKPYPVREKLRDMDYQVEPSEFGGDREDFVNEVFDLAEKRFQLSLELIDHDWDLFFLMFTGDARLQHYIDDQDLIFDLYEEIDRYIGELKEAIDEEVEIMVLSDHGFNRLDTVFDLGKWLVEESYMEESHDSERGKLYGRLKQKSSGEAIPGSAYMPNIHAGAEVEEEIAEKLTELEHDGKKVFRDFIMTNGDCEASSNVPDIIPVPRRGVCHVSGYLEEVFSHDSDEVRIPGNEGVIITSLTESMNKPGSEDVLPTILESLDVEFSGIDGDSLL